LNDSISTLPTHIYRRRKIKRHSCENTSVKK